MPRRKSPNISNTSNTSKDKIITWKIALYIRLSREDGKEESLSVKNQRQILAKYLESFGEDYAYTITDSYIDDGYTGTDSARKDFQRLLGDIKTGLVNCVIVKDLSRLSRNYSEAGYYLENYFVNHDVRFISLELPALDSYKYPEQMNSLIVPIQNVINDDFCRQTSVKIRGVLNVKRSNGEFIGAFAPYGYQKDPADKHKLIIDEEAAQIVCDIYSWFTNGGMSKRGIAIKLTSLGIPAPSDYKKQNGFKYRNPHEKYNNSQLQKLNWNTNTITEILTNKVYLGHMIQGRYRIKSYKIHKAVHPPENEWFVAENTHEPLITQNIFDKAQELQLRNTRTAPNKGGVHLFSGFVRCADCGRTLHRKISKNNSYLFCRQYADVKKCTIHSIREDILEKSVLETIKKQISLAINLAETINKINQTPIKNSNSERLDDMLKKQRGELQNITRISDSLYIDWKNGDITQEEYKRHKSNFAEKIEQLQKSIEEIKEVKKEYYTISNEIGSDNIYLEQFIKYQNITKLTREILVELVDIIFIHENKEITIRFTFADQYKNILNYIGKLCI